MKKLIVSSLVAFAAACGQASDWLYDASAKTITEQNADGDSWVFNVTVKSATDHTLNLGQVNTQGTSELVDMKGTITDGDGTEWKIVTMPSYRNQAKATFKKFYLPDDITSIPGDAFREKGITEIKLPANLQSLGGTAFYSCKSLTSVTPLFPETVTSVGGSAFSYAPVRGDVVFPEGTATSIGTDANNGWGTFDRAGGITSVDMSGLTITRVGSNHFRECSSLKTVFFPSTLTAVNGANAFYSTKNINTVKFASLPDDILTAFTGLANYKTRFYYCPTLGDWNGFIEAQKEAGTYKTWDEESATNKGYYNTAFPDGPEPVGNFLMGSTHVWLVKYTVEVKTVNLQVTGNVLATADEGFDPAYGVYQDVQCPKTCVAPEYASLNDVVYHRTGWRVDQLLEEGTVPVDSGTDGVCEFDVQDSGSYQLTWFWEPCAYKLTLGEVDARFGSCTVTPVPDFGGTHYTSNSVVTLTAMAAEGATFVKWVGDVPADIAESAQIQITMDGNKKVTPAFVGPWVYSPGTVTDGDWAFGVTGTRDAIRIVEASKAGALGTIDLTKPIVDGGAFVEIAESAFYRKTGSAALKEFIMSDTVITLGGSAFRETTLKKITLSKNLQTIGGSCFYQSAIEEITPFLPESVTSIGAAAFSTHNLKGDLVMPKGVHTALADDAATGQGLFQYTDLTSADLSGVPVKRIGWAQFKLEAQWGSLTNVVFGEELESLSGASFGQAIRSGATLTFQGGPVTLESDSVFGDSAHRPNALTIRYVVPKGKGWEEYFAATEACQLTKLTAGEKDTYRARFPNTRVPAYKVKLAKDTIFQYLCYDGSRFGLTVIVK